MRTRRLGRAGLEISLVGFGAFAIGGGDHKYGWGPQEDEDSIAAIHRSLELGVNWIDTSPSYGLGRSEEVVGRAITDLSEKPYISTKCGELESPDGGAIFCLDPDSIRRECEQSLQRLGVDAIDLYQLHWPFPEEDIEEAWATLSELRDEGKVRHIGVSNFDVSQLRRAEAIAPVEWLQPPYSLVRRSVEAEILPYCHEHGIGVIVYSPMGSGLLTGAMTPERLASLPDDDWRKRGEEFQEPLFSRSLEFVEILKTIGERHDVGPGEVAIAWTLRHPAVTGAIVGFRRVGQVDGLLPAAAQLELNDEDYASLTKGSEHVMLPDRPPPTAEGGWANSESGR